MTMTSDAAIPVALVPWSGTGFADDDDLAKLGLPVAAVLRARREEALERRHAEAEAAERLDRIEMRRNFGVLMAQSHAIANGLPWSPTAPFKDWPTSDQWVDAMFRQQDREDHRIVHRAMVEAGLLGEIGPPEPVQRSSSAATVVPESGSCTPPPAGRSRSAASMSPSRARLLDRLVAFSHRCAGAESCPCPSCVAYWAAKHPEVTR
jgi:hypothetical protein